MNPIDTPAFETALEQKKPSKKMSLIRQLMPRINGAIGRGLSKKEVWESLNGAGLEMSYNMFVTYLSRIETRKLGAKPVSDAGWEIPGDPNPGPRMAHDALGKARKHATEKDYSKITRDQTTRIKK
jgi:hypothetical protein